VDRVVRDRTGLRGQYQVHLTWVPLGMAAAPDATVLLPDGPSIFAAVEEQLGLRLESTTGPVEVLVIDRVEPPTPN
jgi:uncharacterized protein (TIGR03435 family)